MNFLQWFIDEQVEEEEAATDLIKQLKLIGDNGYGLLMLDKEMAQRTFTEPTPAE
jgi:ferritin